MSSEGRVRNWMRISTALDIERTFYDRGLASRTVNIEDVDRLAILMDRACRNTIDWERETPEQCRDEMHGTLSGKYGPFLADASFVIVGLPTLDSLEGDILAASLVTLWNEKPLLAFSMTAPDAQGKGYAGFLIERSISALVKHGYPEFFLVVTGGNTAAERLYARLGFVSLGPARPGEPPPEA